MTKVGPLLAGLSCQPREFHLKTMTWHRRCFLLPSCAFSSCLSSSQSAESNVDVETDFQGFSQTLHNKALQQTLGTLAAPPPSRSVSGKKIIPVTRSNSDAKLRQLFSTQLQQLMKDALAEASLRDPKTFAPS